MSSTYPIGVFDYVCVSLQNLESLIVGDIPPEDHRVFDEREEDQHHAGQEPHLHRCHGVTHGDPSTVFRGITTYTTISSLGWLQLLFYISSQNPFS